MSKRAGAVSAETKACILRAAEDEFFERGFQGSSLRRICAAAGVTTGALYFFFSGKDDLFENVLSIVTGPFMTFMRGHYESERSAPSKPSAEGEQADLDISLFLIDFYFQHQRTWAVLRGHIQHPAVQRFLDAFVEESTAHYAYILETADAAKTRRHPVDPFALHQFVHMQADTMLTLIAHGFDREEMIAHARTMVRMLRGAFQAL